MNIRSLNFAFGIAIAACMLIGPAAAARAQQARPVSSLQLGAYGGGSIVSASSSSFTEFPGVASCISVDSGAFNGGSGSGFAGAFVLGIKPSFGSGLGGHVGGMLKVGVASASTTFTTDVTIGATSDQNGNLFPTVSRYSVTAHTTELSVEPVGSLWLSEKMPFILSVGGRLGFAFGATYDYGETLVSPAGGTFSDGGTERNKTSGNLSGKNTLQAALTLGLGYDVRLSPIISIRPEISGALGLIAPLKQVEWKSNEVRFGLSVLYTVPRAQSSPLQDE